MGGGCPPDRLDEPGMPALAFEVQARGRHVRQRQLCRVCGTVVSDRHLLQVWAPLEQTLVVARRHALR